MKQVATNLMQFAPNTQWATYEVGRMIAMGYRVTRASVAESGWITVYFVAVN